MLKKESHHVVVDTPSPATVRPKVTGIDQGVCDGRTDHFRIEKCVLPFTPALRPKRGAGFPEQNKAENFYKTAQRPRPSLAPHRRRTVS
jgi:hypothetical protein